MKQASILALSLLLAGRTTHARFLSGEESSSKADSAPSNVDYSSDLGCGLCILSNYTYCVQGPHIGAEVSAIPASYCCKDASCAQASDPKWACSDKFEHQ